MVTNRSSLLDVRSLFSLIYNIQLCAYQLLYRMQNFHFNVNITYILAPWCRVLLEKLTGLQLVKKFPAFHGTRKFITALTSVRHLSLSWASPIQSTYPHPTSCRSILILSTHLRLGLPSPQWSLSLRFPHQDPIHTLLLTHTRHMPSLALKNYAW